jgi:hypothetical protein
LPADDLPLASEPGHLDLQGGGGGRRAATPRRPAGRRTIDLLLAPARQAPFRNAQLAAEVPNRALLRFDPFDGLALKGLVVATAKFTLLFTQGGDSSLAPLSTKSTTPHLTTSAHDQVLAHLCAELNATETVFPGTDLRLIYQMVGSS